LNCPIDLIETIKSFFKDVINKIHILKEKK